MFVTPVVQDAFQHIGIAARRHRLEEIPADRLLTFDLRDGWRPLCEFLRVEVPDIPFPKTNSSKEFVEQEWKQA